MLTKETYSGTSILLLKTSRPSGKRLFANRYVFMHDNEPAHTSKILKNY